MLKECGGIRKVVLKLGRTDQDILEWLERQSSKQGAIKALIREKLQSENA